MNKIDALRDEIAALTAQLAAAMAWAKEQHAAADRYAARISALDAQLAGARDKALLEAAERFPDGRQPWPPNAIRKAVLALRDKPAETAPQPDLCSTSELQTARAVTVQEAAKIVEEYLKDNYSKLTYAQAMELDPKRRREWTAWLYADEHIRAIAGGGDE